MLCDAVQDFYGLINNEYKLKLTCDDQVNPKNLFTCTS